MEPPRPRLPDRAGPPLLSAAAPRLRIRRRTDVERGTDAVASVPSRDITEAVRTALLVAGFVLAATSRGDVAVLSVLLGLGVGRRVSAFAAAAALAASMVRWGSPSLGAIAGAQAVLGPAGWTGSTTAVASAWLAALGLVAAAAPARRLTLVPMAASVTPFAVAAADVAVGPSAGGALGVRIAGTVVALGLAVLVTRIRWAPRAGVALAVAALAAAGLAR